MDSVVDSREVFTVVVAKVRVVGPVDGEVVVDSVVLVSAVRLV